MPQPTLPNLTFNMSSTYALARGSSNADWIAEIKTRISADSTYWEEASGASTHWEMKPKAGSGTPNLRVVVAHSVNTGEETQDNGQLNQSDRLSVGICMNPGGTTVQSYDSADPYGNGSAFSGYWGCGDTDNMDHWWFIESSETIAIFLHDSLANHQCMYGFVAGAIVRAADTSEAESDHRVYGMTTSGYYHIAHGMWAGTANFTGHNSGHSNHSGFFSPTEPGTWRYMQRIETFDLTNNGNKHLTGAGGSNVGLPFHWRNFDSPYQYVGAARQMCAGCDNVIKLTQSSGGSPKRYSVGTKNSGPGDVLGFFNI